MLSRVNQELDESKEADSFSDLPCELTITEDNRGATSGIGGNNLRFNMATFEASKKLLRESESPLDEKEPVDMAAEKPLRE